MTAGGSNLPWQMPGEGPLVGGRPSLVTGAGTTASVSCEVLPTLGSGTDDSGRRWTRYELPLPRTVGDGTRWVQEVLEVELDRGLGRSTTSIELRGHAPRVSTQEGRPAEVEAHPAAAAAVTRAIIDRHIEFVYGLCDAPPEGATVGRGATFVPAAAAVERWMLVERERRPRVALIVRLAEAMETRIAALCQNPRRVLRRERQLAPLGRVQEVDAACLRWLARQPGRSVAQKAGSRQRVMAVTRSDDADTPENRVVRDLLLRSLRAASAYLEECRTWHADVLEDDPRVAVVRRWRRTAAVLLRDSPVAAAGGLAGPGRANYVLQHDARYRPAWLWYGRLVRQQTLEDDVWRWRGRLWSEHTHLALLAAMYALPARGGGAGADVTAGTEQRQGRFLSEQSGCGTWRLQGVGGRYTLDLVAGRDAPRHPLVPKEVIWLCPDWLLIRRGSKQHDLRLALVFADPEVSLERPAGDAADSLRVAGGPNAPFRAVVVRPAVAAGGGVMRRGGVSEVALTLPLQHESPTLIREVAWALDLAA